MPWWQRKKDCTVLAQNWEQVWKLLICITEIQNGEEKGRMQKLVTVAGEQSQEIRYHRSWALFLPKAELLLGQHIKINTQFLAANSAGHSCSIPSVHPSKVNTKAVASQHHESSSTTEPQQQLQWVQSEPRTPLLHSPVTTSPCLCHPRHLQHHLWKRSKDWPHYEGQSLVLPDTFQTSLDCFWGYEVGGNVVNFVRKAETHFQPVVDV